MNDSPFNFRVWLLRRRLRRMGFTEATNPATAQSPRRVMEKPWIRNLVDSIKIGLITVGIVIWVVFYLRTAEPTEIALPPIPAPLPPDTMKSTSPAHEKLYRHAA